MATQIAIKEESEEEECYEVVEVIDDLTEAEANANNAQGSSVKNVPMEVDDDSKAASELHGIQLQLSARKKEMVKIKSRIRSCLAKLRQQDDIIEGLQEQLSKNKFASSDDDKRKRFDWTGIKAAHLISKVFEHCDPITKSESPNDQDDGKEKNKCHYTTDFHRFAVTLYFFSPKAYFYLNMIAPMFPDRNYIRQWVTSGHVEKLFPKGVWRDEFND